MACNLSSGSRLPRTSAMPAWVPTVCAVARLSPVNITGVTPNAFRSATACADEDLMVSATAQMAATRSLLANNVTVRQLVHALQGGLRGQPNRPALFNPAVVSQHMGMAVDHPCTPRPATA